MPDITLNIGPEDWEAVVNDLMTDNKRYRLTNTALIRRVQMLEAEAEKKSKRKDKEKENS